LIDTSPAQKFFYRGRNGSGIRGVIQLCWGSGEAVFFNDSHLKYALRPPQSDIDASRPVMQAIERRLAAQCGMPAKITESCNLVECPPIP
jgi:hypothetical protein